MIVFFDVRIEDCINKQLKNKQLYFGLNVVFDVVVGGVRGVIYCYSDLLVGLYLFEKVKVVKKDLL